ncbi:MAG: hypothetical protein AB7H43_15690, partial [Acidimicrobiia bacterium]
MTDAAAESDPAADLQQGITDVVRMLMGARRYTTQTQLAAKLNMPEQTLSTKLSGKWRLKDIPLVAAALEVQPHVLLMPVSEVLRGGWAARGSNPAPED